MSTKTNPILDNFAVFILTHGRPEKVFTHKTLRTHGYSGRIILVIDDLDKTREKYVEKYGADVIVFDKKAIAKTFDEGDNFDDMRAIIYARNASFEIAKFFGIKNFIELDDDYTRFEWRFTDKLNYVFPCESSEHSDIRNLDAVFAAMLKFYRSSGASSVAMAQGGDFIGGSNNDKAMVVTLKRKCMNSFICSVDRPFQFVGRINEDVNSYTRLASVGLLFFTTNHVSLVQKTTQSNSGGMTELYLDSGTYVKSFYSVMYMPSAVKIRPMGDKNKRLHHSVTWDCAVPLIVPEKFKKLQ
jgi:hypothetical protein